MPAGGKVAFPPITACDVTADVNRRSIAADLDGTLILSLSSFPYYMLVAIEAGSLLRGVVILLCLPLVLIAHIFVSESLGIKIFFFVVFAGLRIQDIEFAARAVLPRFYAANVRRDSYELFERCDKKVVVTVSPRVMVEPFVREYLGADKVLGTELEVNPLTQRATGFAKKPGILFGKWKKMAVMKEFGDETPDVGIGNRESDHEFMSICKEGYMVHSDKSASAVPLDRLKARLRFHDGRLVQLPTPLTILVTFLWLPFGLLLAFLRLYFNLSLRIYFGLSLLKRVVRYTYPMLGIQLVINGRLPPPPSPGSPGNLYVCNHRTTLDPIVIAIALGRKISYITSSVSHLSRLLSPIPTVALTRDRKANAARIRSLLQKGDLLVCPEGTTCREPFMLRFREVFAELSDRIVPVAVNTKQSMFYGSTIHGVKFWDAFFFFMNPRPRYEVTFLDRLPEEMTCSGGRSAMEVANHVQRLLAVELGFHCTQLTGKDKRMLLGRNDG
ncbi:Glycerol-3-phosphate 1-O-acyltransferase [Bertholletia excelsa]